jgi:hypothetical protein
MISPHITPEERAALAEIRAFHDDEYATGLDDVLGRYTTDDEADAEDEARELRMLRRDL